MQMVRLFPGLRRMPALGIACRHPQPNAAGPGGLYTLKRRVFTICNAIHLLALYVDRDYASTSLFQEQIS